jgi:hypothetical protein
MKLVNLSSVGTVLDTETGDTYPMDLDGIPVIDEGVIVNLNDIDEEWAEALSTDDLDTVLDVYSTLPSSIDYV